MGFVTTWPLFLGIVAVYVGVIYAFGGGKKAFFEPDPDITETE